MTQPVFQDAIHRCQLFGTFSEDVLKTAGSRLAALTPAELFRINPLRFASQASLAEETCIDLFVCGTRAGLFELSFDVICTTCGGILHSSPDLGALQSLVFCELCMFEKVVTLDEMIEASFTASPSIAPTAVDRYRDYPTFRHFHFSHNFQPSPELLEYLQTNGLAFVFIHPHEEAEIPFHAAQGDLVRLVSVSPHTGVSMRIDGRPGSGDADFRALVISDQGFSKNDLTLPQGTTSITVKNASNRTVGIKALRSNVEKLHEILRERPSGMAPYLSGRAILHNKYFRRYFRINEARRDFGLLIRNVTVLFTDLVGSTQMYDRLGDVSANRVVQQHFSVLNGLIERHGGVTVKTMGDAVMATFLTPKAATECAVEMIRSMTRVLWRDGAPLGLKIGIHEGPALTVSNQGIPDYFGQTINIAARIQKLAGENEIRISGTAMNEPGIEDILSRHGFESESETVRLKGVDAPVTVFCCRPRDESPVTP
ncbi:MAG TPA: DUF5939 domain-containing protein [Candidatus Ozemobacteraceae bacterium]|nr:DUF5939 domain-containing protein [Candidatus Ozemobacteraceae bacterium]